MFIFDFFGEFIEGFGVAFGAIVISSDGAVMKIFDVFKFGIFFDEDGIIFDLIFRGSNRVHEIHGVVEIEKDENESGGENNFKDDCENFEKS